MHNQVYGGTETQEYTAQREREFAERQDDGPDEYADLGFTGSPPGEPDEADVADVAETFVPVKYRAPMVLTEYLEDAVLDYANLNLGWTEGSVSVKHIDFDAKTVVVRVLEEGEPKFDKRFSIPLDRLAVALSIR